MKQNVTLGPLSLLSFEKKIKIKEEHFYVFQHQTVENNF